MPVELQQLKANKTTFNFSQLNMNASVVIITYQPDLPTWKLELYEHLKQFFNLKLNWRIFFQNQQRKHQKNVSEICLKLTIKKLERRHVSNFEQISHVVLMFPWLTLNKHVATGKQVLLIITKSFGKNVNCGVWFRSSTLSIHSLKNVDVSSSFVVTFLSCH